MGKKPKFSHFPYSPEASSQTCFCSEVGNCLVLSGNVACCVQDFEVIRDKYQGASLARNFRFSVFGSISSISSIAIFPAFLFFGTQFWNIAGNIAIFGTQWEYFPIQFSGCFCCKRLWMFGAEPGNPDGQKWMLTKYMGEDAQGARRGAPWSCGLWMAVTAVQKKKQMTHPKTQNFWVV